MNDISGPQRGARNLETPNCTECGEPALISVYRHRAKPRHLCGGCYAKEHPISRKGIRTIIRTIRTEQRERARSANSQTMPA